MEKEQQKEEIFFIDRQSGERRVEKVYGDAALRWLYQTEMGKSVSGLLAKKWFSQLYGGLQSSSWSKSKVAPFIQQFQIPINDYLPEEGKSESDAYPYSSFNNFFIRRFKAGKREFAKEKNVLAAPAEGRYLVFNSPAENQTFTIKGSQLRVKDLLGEFYDERFAGGALAISRLCPVDYHRFHFPDNGELFLQESLEGPLQSVNPVALISMKDILVTNQRDVALIKSENFGLMAYVEVGAICVGKIVQTGAKIGKVKKGEEKGYFLFGGSTVILVSERGALQFDEDLVKNTQVGMETFLRLGEGFATQSK